MRLMRHSAGLSVIELLVAIVIAMAIGSAGLSWLNGKGLRDDIAQTHQEASVYLSALAEYYLRYCAISPFPQPSYTVLRDLGILAHEVPINPLSNSSFIPSIEFVGTNRALARLELSFNEAALAAKVSYGGRGAMLQGDTVVWQIPVHQQRDAYQAFHTNQMEIFSTNSNCRG